MSPARTLLDRVLLPALIFGWSLAVRAAGASALLKKNDGAFFFGNDAYYHARRIWYSVVNFPDFLTRDPYLNHPHGAQPIWSPAFDWLAAALVKVVVGANDQAAMERLLVWIPPVLGAMTVVALYFVALRFFSRPIALVAALFLSIMPGHFWYSQFGFVDHHVAVALVTTWLLAASMSLFAQESGADAVGARAWRSSVGLGVASAGALLLWPGCLIHVTIVQLALVVHLLASPDVRHASSRARLYALASAVAFVLVFPASWGNQWERWGDLSPLVLSHFQPFWLGSAAICFGSLGEFWRRRGFPEGATERVLHAAVVAGLVAGLALTFVPVLSGGLGESWAWFAKGETFQSSVGESKGLFVGGADRAEQVFTRAVYLAPVFLVAFAVVTWRRPRHIRDPLLFFAWWCLALATATLMQRRFMNSSAVSWSLLFAWAVSAGLSLCRDILRRRVAGEGFAWVVLATLVLLVFVFFPALESYKPYLSNLRRVSGGEDALALFELQRMQVLREATARWLRAHTPPTAGWLDPQASPEYAVLAPWSGGHVLKYVAHRPVIWDNFGDDVGRENFVAGRSYYGSLAEEGALGHLDGLGVRYVIARDDHAKRSGSPNPKTMMSRLSRFSGAEALLGSGGQQDPEIRLDALQHHRLIYASMPLASEPGRGRPYFKVFELVTGARVSGFAPPGARVMARLAVTPARYEPFYYVSTVVADENGRYDFVLPYSNEGFSPAVSSGKYYEIGIGRVRGKLVVKEDAVRRGLFVAGPSFQLD